MESFLDNIESRCLECGDVIGYGRLNRKFCSLTCKNRYHNKVRKPTIEMARVLRILERNRDILAKLMQLEVRSLDRVTLQHLGFDCQYSTSFHWVGRKRQVFTCFEYTYELTPSRIRGIARIPVENFIPPEPEEDSSSEGL